MIKDFLPSGQNRSELAPVIITDEEPIDPTDQEPDFVPPEDIDTSHSVASRATDDDGFEVPDESPEDNTDYSKPPKKSGFRMPKLTKKQWLVVGIFAMVVLLSGTALAWKMTHKPKPAPQAPVVAKKEEPPKPIVYTSKLTGATVTQGESELPVTAIMIENSPDARPQSGLKDAGVVYEAVAEGGITRFLTLFQEAQPNYIGPVRSVRPYYLDWLVPFDAPVAHVGGSAEALAQIRAEGLKDLDYAFNSKYYHRVSNRYAPHNVYTSRAELLELQKSKGWTTSSFTAWTRKEDKPSTTPNAKTMDFSISGFLYNPHFDYDAASNSYKRSEAGKPHVDEKTGAQISPKVVIAIVVPKSLHDDGIHSVYSTAGSGKAFVFQDGTVTEATWQKKDRKGAMEFIGADGKPQPLNKGNTWISVVGDAGSVTYAP